jgi:hypothetical protein
MPHNADSGQTDGTICAKPAGSQADTEIGCTVDLLN